MQQAQYDYQQALPQYQQQQQQQQQQHNQGRGGYNRGRAQGGRAAYRGGRGTGQHHTQLNASAAPYQMHDVYAVTGAGIGGAAPPPYAYMAGGGMDSGAAGYFQGDQQMVSLFGNPAAPITAFVPPQPQVQLDENSTEFCKALAKVAKPCPPWSIGSKPTESLAEEVARLDAFIAPQQQDSSDSSELWDSLRKAATANCPGTTLQYLGSNSWGFFPYKARLNIALLGFPDDDTTTAAFSRSLFSNGFAVESDVRDGSGARCLLVNHSVTKRIAVVRFGAATAAQARTVDVIRQCPRLASVRQSLNCLIVLLRQSKIIDDVDGAAFSDEAAAVMLLSIANSYPELPPSDRIIIDFFLTFGFKEHFGTDRFSVDMGGMVTPVAKVHTDAALSVIDPGDHTRNLTGGVTDHKLTFARSSFEYCYHVVSEFTKEANPHNRRGQSPLSTMIGGEPYWPRVVELAKQHVEPYHSFLASQKQTIFDEMMRASTRRSTRR